MRCEGFLCNRIELSGVRIALNGCVEQFSVKHLEPRAKPRQLPRVQLLDGLFDVFGSRHARDITPGEHPEKA